MEALNPQVFPTSPDDSTGFEAHNLPKDIISLRTVEHTQVFRSDSVEKPRNASTGLSVNGKSPTISTAPPFLLWSSKDERRILEQNLDLLFIGPAPMRQHWLR